MGIKIKTARNVTPMIYAYSTPDVISNAGWIKIGYTERDVDTRIKEQLGTARIAYNLEWQGNAIYDDGTGDTFNDKPFHEYLRKLGIANELEWFQIGGEESLKHFNDFRQNRGVLKKLTATPYNLRGEQAQAVSKTLDYLRGHDGGEFLWNAKPRFGKTLATYDLCKRAEAQSVLIVTNRPAIANSWYKDYVKFCGGGKWLFVSDVDALKGKPFVISRADLPKDTPYIEFVSLQDLKGSKYFGGELPKLAEVADMTWDILVVDEAHEGVDTFKTDIAFDRIKRRFTLHLSGTPFKALANNKFSADAIYNWTYADEQERKANWADVNVENPYAELPSLNLYTYQMSEIVREELKRGVDLDGTSAEYAFDLNEFFATDKGKFVYDSSVDKFLDALTAQKKFPFSTSELREELRHTFWLLNRVDSAKALAAKLKAHPVFKDYKIILAAGDGKIDDDDANQKSFDKVVKAIAKHSRTITLSVGQLTTGVTIPEWTGVLMLANMHSPALYVQAAFRAQNPCMFKRGGKYLRKENAYVFDFDPARTLTIYEAFANDLAGGGRGDSETRKANVSKLLNFFPVIGEDEDGELIELDAEKILSVPRKIRAVEVVERGFQSDFLFQNISRVFNATAEVIDIIAKLPAVSAENFQSEVRNAKETLYLDSDGEIALPSDYVIGQAVELFGEKIYSVEGDTARAVKEGLNAQIKSTLDTAQISYGKEFTSSERKKLERQLKTAADILVDKAFKNHEIDKKTVADKTALTAAFQEKLAEQINEFMKTAEETVVERVETAIQERDKNSVEDDVRDRLRGFSRTIPAFLMAYGEIDNPVTLATFDKIIPDAVFSELTGITLDEFRYLRDVGKLFDPVTFDDAVKVFLNLRRKLADYFDETNAKDIFDYIPPQRTNQIFTPKETVRHMCDLLEAESPGCFDDPNKKFVDLYMKSGLFIAEIVKRLYRSPKLKALFPTKAERLRHIFIAQVYGLAPTEIIYRIAANYILGCGIDINSHNLHKANALDTAKADKLNELLEENFMINFDAPPLRDVLPILKRGLKIDTFPTPRALKSDAEKLLRTRTNAEVFTPSHVVKYMVDALDDGQIDSRWLEIACGEAPFITNRYDAESGEDIPYADRAGILDRKLRRIPANVDKFTWASRAVQSVYGYELQVDSLLIARANVLMTFAEYVKDFSTAELDQIAEIISRNFWRFDALNPPPRQINLFDDVTDWNTGDSFLVSGDKFDFVIGNPPYQEETENNGRQPPVYDKFMEAAYKVGEKTVLITPARFLFNQGGTAKDFNQRMLNDPHLKVLEYEPDASKYFKGVDIKGGVAITLRDETRDFGAIGTFTKYAELNAIQKKVCVNNPDFHLLNKIIHTPIAYKLSDKFFAEHPELICKLYKPDDNALRTNIFERLTEIFFDAKPDDGNNYIQVLGLSNSKRTYKWIRRDYVTAPALIGKHKVFIPESNGAGTFGEELSSPLIGEPAQGCTQTFITVGGFDTAAEAEACLSYVKSKFARVMLGILKVTQHNPPATWAKVPMQDFNPATSDIDWRGDIDGQLYRKYALDATEIEFIETHVKAM